MFLVGARGLFLLVVLFQEQNSVVGSSEYHKLYDSKNSSKVLNSMLTDSKYDKRIRPKFEGPSVLVNLSMYISSIGSLDSKEMDFTISLFLRQMWYDPRLAYGDNYTQRVLSIGSPIIDQIWKPDTYIANEKDKVAPKDQFLLTINRQGFIVYSQRMTVKASCHMDLHFFPMDEQVCSLFIGSYGFSQDDVDYGWIDGNKSVSVSKSLTMSQFELQQTYVKRHASVYATGTFIELEMSVMFARKAFPYIIQNYLPSLLIVVLSWVSFWIPRSSPPARVALGITTVLSITTLTFSVQSSLPKVSYVKGIDWYLMVSFCYVFAALIEYPSASALHKLLNKIPPLLRRCWRVISKPSQIQPRDEESQTGLNNKMIKVEVMPTTTTDADGDVDKIARIIFPLTFFLYNIGYWIVYVHEIEVIPQYY